MTPRITRDIPMHCQILTGWLNIIMLTIADITFREVRMKGATCCWKLKTMQYTNTCPMQAITDSESTSRTTEGQVCMKEMIETICLVAITQVRLRRNTQRLVFQQRIIGPGLYFYLTSAWKSGRNPSARMDTASKQNPIAELGFFVSTGLAVLVGFVWFPLKNIITPTETTIPTQSFSLPSF